MIELIPFNCTNSSINSTVAIPSLFAIIFPKSPTCLSSSDGPPWFFLNGLKWPLAVLQPPDKSPNWCIWKPCLPGVNPVTVAFIFVLLPCCCDSNITLPDTPLPPSGFNIHTARFTPDIPDDPPIGKKPFCAAKYTPPAPTVYVNILAVYSYMYTLISLSWTHRAWYFIPAAPTRL